MPNSHEKGLTARLFRVFDHEEFNIFPFEGILPFSHVPRGHYQCPRTRCGWGHHVPQSTQLLAATSSGKSEPSDSDEMIGRGKQIVNVDWWLRFCTQVKFIVDGKSCANQLIQLALVPSTSIGLPLSFDVSSHSWKGCPFPHTKISSKIEQRPRTLIDTQHCEYRDTIGGNPLWLLAWCSEANIYSLLAEDAT